MAPSDDNPKNTEESVPELLKKVVDNQVKILDVLHELKNVLIAIVDK